jgi:hypothetical protein
MSSDSDTVAGGIDQESVLVIDGRSNRYHLPIRGSQRPVCRPYDDDKFELPVEYAKQREGFEVCENCSKRAPTFAAMGRVD